MRTRCMLTIAELPTRHSQAESSDHRNRDLGYRVGCNPNVATRQWRPRHGRLLLCRHAPSAVALGLGAGPGRAQCDVRLSGAELQGLMAELLVSRETPLGHRRLGPWLTDDGACLGRRYLSERALRWTERG